MGQMVECSFKNYVLLGSSPVAVTETSDFAPALSKEPLDIQATTECGFTLKSVCDMTRTYREEDFLTKFGKIIRHWNNLNWTQKNVSIKNRRIRVLGK